MEADTRQRSEERDREVGEGGRTPHAWEHRGLLLAENPTRGAAIPLSRVAAKSHNKNKALKKRNLETKPQFQSSCWHS